MPLAFSFNGIILVKDKFLAKSESLKDSANELSNFCNHLQSSKFSDDYLIGIESMSSNLDYEKSLLEKIGLVWNEGGIAKDFYITNQGSYIAPWLLFAKVEETITGGKNPFFSVYKYCDDVNNSIIAFDENLVAKFPAKSLKLDRNNWGLVAKAESNNLYKPSLAELLSIATINHRICPQPTIWNRLHTLAIEADFNQRPSPKLPLILGAWWDTSDTDKATRFKELCEWCHIIDVSDVVWTFLSSLDESEWHHANEL